ncbi:MAG: type II toxin-antitoxin system YafQ family toxin [Candidatus Paceibacterota bacterium]|jgi:mRNA-degrading endonuclease YafQ of YafQ-DinJ toxin-antitoxin module
MRKLVSSASFNSKFRKFLKNHSDLEKKTKKAFELLSKDVFSSQLKTHKLSGGLRMFYGADINFQYRIVFGFDNENVYLINIGSHDEVY